ncbi:hypothetical protein [Limnoglobus roseus]|uniref:Uncharacterized protein n=1 Tax=Limnoglobus roseus TaxID=2598579 RepID=A0A5C1AEE4_9BACT|nr:hypothetical protein [Limnoglobus roseus]QEL16955.1 hypothetical protein PX52LOC_03931 [Limnoglobus roseus]
MRTIAAMFLVALGGSAFAEEKEPFPARTTPFLIPAVHTHEALGTAKPLGRFATAGIERNESGGYIGGSKLVRGEGRGVQDGTFGWDYTGFGRRPGRFFLGWYNDSPKQSAFLPKYNSEGPRVTDVVALQPYKKAVREAKAEKHGGGGEEGGGGH